MKRHYLEDPNLLVVVAPEKPIEAEWQVIIARGQVLCASQYRQFREPCYQSGMPERVQQGSKGTKGQRSRSRQANKGRVE
ncbi:hypothetical protein [Leptolyngbya sp. FACHB-711]|uniref:hypothetical protein n=1 Tax=unclassified Leptolyngbya TaxID=2650499 RepID=UPI001F54C610|nr:hypothetical protein [Leptolyngbya sp. FACHB-711]